MNRRAFIKGIIAAGVLTFTPLEPVCAAFRPKYITATDMLRQNKEFLEGMESTFRDRILYGSSRGGGKPMTGLKAWEAEWAALDEYIRPSRAL